MADFTIQEEFSKELSVTKTNAGLVSGFTVLEAARARLPEEVHIVNLSGGDFEGFEEEDLEFFSNLKLLDASDNNLTSIEELSRLKLVELRVPVNALQQIHSFEGAFACLKVLDVSFNLLSAQAMAELSRLPQLTKLDISGNNVGALPMFGSDAFPRLQILIAEQADLASQDLLALQYLPCVRELRLSGNRVTGIPLDCDDVRGFASLELLDLSHCMVTSLEAIEQARHFAKLKKLLLHHNDLIPQQRLSKHPLSKKLDLQEDKKSTTGSLGSKSAKQSISQMYCMDLKKANLDYPSSRMQAFASVSQKDMEEAFERLQDPMSIFNAEEYETVGTTSNQVDSEDGEEEKKKDSRDNKDSASGGAFLTSLVEHEEEGGTDEEEEEEDPSNKLARAFGLDPTKVFSADHLGLDATAAINALKFAIEHPLVDYNATGKIEHHMKLTESALRKKLETRRFSPVKSGHKFKPSKRKENIQEMLLRMKQKLATAKEKIAQVPAS